MLVFLSILVVTSCIQIAFGQQHWESPYSHTFQRAASECAGYLRLSNAVLANCQTNNAYPEDLICMDLVHCILVDLRAWTNRNGFVRQQLEVFLAKHGNYNPQNLQTCLDQELAALPPRDFIPRSYKTFKCYLTHYGFPTTQSKFLRYSDPDRDIMFREAIDMSNLTVAALDAFVNGDFLSPQITNLGYIFVLRLGFYTPEAGFNKEVLYIQLGDEDIFSDEVSQCEDSVKQQYCEEPERVARIWLQCYSKYNFLLTLLQGIAREVAQEAADRCSGITTSQPNQG
ncbi:uncharacterized protein LOC129760745 [Uranotaenia lowii]|uniref:uncharacterized protein LOC129760745 n=1 Tax=Uranotaenia lowii TaxID=190385 RepID=UPI00247B29D5|nr:uncharacterized protein LOC129760745 [Uranotaenia lowii]